MRYTRSNTASCDEQPSLILELDAFLRSPRLSVGNKLCFLCLHLPKFYAIIGLSCNRLFLLVCNP